MKTKLYELKFIMICRYIKMLTIEKILQNAKEACDDFEYEDGSAACEEAVSILA